MSRIVITLTGKGIRQAGVNALVKSLKDAYGEGIGVHVQRKELAESRSDRFAEATSQIEDAKSTAEELRDELTEWKDGMPENLQGGGKAEELEEAIGQLDEFVEKCDDLVQHEVSFPGMR